MSALARLRAARTAALAAHPGATVVRVRAPEGLVKAARAELGLPDRLPNGTAIHRDVYPAMLRACDIERVEVDMSITWKEET